MLTVINEPLKMDKTCPYLLNTSEMAVCKIINCNTGINKMDNSLIVNVNDRGIRLYSFIRIMEILVPEEGVHTVAIYADIIVAYVSEKTVCGVAFHVFIVPLLFSKGAPSMRIMTCGT